MTKQEARIETYAHIKLVSALLSVCASDLIGRGISHDLSKLESPESDLFEEYTPKLKDVTYGSDEYKQLLAELKPALDHHYANNRHHPEFFGEGGIRGMNLLDVLEMFCDWVAACQRHADGDIFKSIEINKHRFGYSEELAEIFTNTAIVLQNHMAGKVD